MMEFISLLRSTFLEILGESQFIFLNNRNLITLIGLLTLLLNLFLALCSFFYIKPLLTDFAMEETLLFLTSSGNSEYANILFAMTADFRNFAGLQWFFILALSILSLFSSATTILASAATYKELNWSFKGLLFRALKSWHRPLVAWFYITLFDIGYVYFAFFSFLPFAFNFGTPSRPAIISYVLLILVTVFYIYLAVVWNLSLVIAVVEEKSGLEAIGKAAELSKGMKLQGFLLNLVFGVVAFLVYLGWKQGNIKSEASMLFVGFLVLVFTWLIKMCALIAFTAFYRKCKQTHGEEIKLEGSLEMEYTKMSLEPLDGAQIP